MGGSSYPLQGRCILARRTSGYECDATCNALGGFLACLSSYFNIYEFVLIFAWFCVVVCSRDRRLRKPKPRSEQSSEEHRGRRKLIRSYPLCASLYRNSRDYQRPPRDGAPFCVSPIGGRTFPCLRFVRCKRCRRFQMGFRCRCVRPLFGCRSQDITGSPTAISGKIYR